MNKLKLNFSLNDTIATIQNDMSVVFGTVDHHELLQKLEYYGVNSLKATLGG